VVPYEVMQAVQSTIYRSCTALNEERWSDYLKLCDADVFRYKVLTYSPEIRRDQCWADRDFKAMKSAFDLIPRHNSDHSRLTRHAVVQLIDHDADGGRARVETQLAVYRTQLDGTMSYLESGQTALYAIGRYLDDVRIENAQALLVARTVWLETRQLDVGSHKPF
jgi:methanesulfonate monooxygenase subunit beta